MSQGFQKRRGRDPAFLSQTYLHRYIENAERNDDDDEDWSGHADHHQSANDAQEAHHPASEGLGEHVVHCRDILGVQSRRDDEPVSL